MLSLIERQNSSSISIFWFACGALGSAAGSSGALGGKVDPGLLAMASLPPAWVAASARRSATANMPARAKRFSGFFASASLTTASNAEETETTSVEGGGGSSCTIMRAMVQAPEPVNGRLAVRSS